MIEKEFTPYEQALALKVLGFDDKCCGAYDKKYKLTMATSDYLDNSSLYRLNDYFGSNTYRCLAPLYQQAFRWFREKHKLCSWVYQSNSGLYHYSILKNDRYLTNGYDNQTSYEEAELKCLKKLIELCTILK